jgi:3-hydroxybutyryl-CoA dehydratase
VTIPCEPVPDPIYFEDIPEGAVFISQRRTITDADIINFAGISGDFDPLHTDDLYIRERTDYRARIAHGLLMLSIGSGLAGAIDGWQMLAYLECNRRFVAPVYAGDTVQVEYRVASKRESRSRPDRGIVALDVRMTNQDGVEVQVGQDVSLIARRPAPRG